MNKLTPVVIDELAFNPISVRGAIENKPFASDRQRSWHVQQTLSLEGETSWHINFVSQDGSQQLHPLADGALTTVLAWLEQNKELLTAKG